MKTTIFSNYDESERYEMAKELLKSSNERKRKTSENDIWEEVSFQEQIEYDRVINRLKSFFNNKICLFIGTLQYWDGKEPGGCIGNFFRLYTALCEGCDYVEIFDKDGKLYIQCSHHDGTHKMQVFVLTDKGKKVFDDWEWGRGSYKNYSKQKINNLIAKNREYSVHPMFAHKIYGIEIKKET